VPTVTRTSLWRRIFWTMVCETLAFSSKVAELWRSPWKPRSRGMGLAQSARPHFGQDFCAASFAISV